MRTWVVVVVLMSATAASAQTVNEKKAIVGIVAGLDPAFSDFNALAETSGIFGTDQLLAHSFRQVYSPALEVSGEIGRALRAGELLGRVRYAHASAREDVPFFREIQHSGRITDPNLVSFDDYRSVTLEFAALRHIASSARATPYVGGAAGIAFVSGIAVHGFGFCGIEASAAPTCPFYQRSTVPVFSGIAGVSFQLAPSTSLAIESGLRYQSNLREDPTDLGFGPFVKDAYAGSRWSIPITTTLRVRF